MERSEIGPNVSLERGTKVRGSTLRNTIVGRDACSPTPRSTAPCSGITWCWGAPRNGESLGDHSEVTTKALMQPRDTARGSMASVDDRCQSYLDLKYHFDPAAASAAGLVSHDSRLGRVRRRRGAGASLRPPVGRGRGRGAGERGPAGGDRPDRAPGGDARHLPASSTSSPTCATRPTGCRTSSRGSTRCSRGGTAGWPSARRPRSSGSAPSPRSSTRRATRSSSRPPCSWTPPSACSAAGANWWCSWSPRSSRNPPSCAPISTSAAGKALEALKRFGTALRDEIEPASDPHAFAVGEDQFSRRLHHEHALTASAPELWRYGLHLQEETEAELAALAERMGARPWRELVEELRGDAPDLDALLPVYRAELDRAHAFVAERELVSIPARSGGRAADARVPGGAGALRGRTSRRRSSSRGRPGGSTSPSPTRPRRRRSRGPPAPGPLPARDPRYGGARGVSRPSPPAGHGPGAASEVRRHTGPPVMVEGWALYCEQLMDESGYYGERACAPLPAGEPALACGPDRARRRPPHPRQVAGGGGRTTWGAPADRAGRARRPRCGDYCALPDLPALLCGGRGASCSAST